jgi:uncharacterized protein (UPF0335 family)
MADTDITTGGADIKKLPKLHDRILARLAKVDAAREDMKEIYAQAKDGNFHMRALKLTVRISKMEPIERYDFLASLNEYCDALDLTGQPDLLGDSADVPQPVDLAVRRAAQAAEPAPAA